MHLFSRTALGHERYFIFNPQGEMYPLILSAPSRHTLNLIFQDIFLTWSIFTAKVTFLWASFAIMGAQNLSRSTMNHKPSCDWREHITAGCPWEAKFLMWAASQDIWREQSQNPQLQGSAQLPKCPVLLCSSWSHILDIPFPSQPNKNTTLPWWLNSRVTRV